MFLFLLATLVEFISAPLSEELFHIKPCVNYQEPKLQRQKLIRLLTFLLMEARSSISQITVDTYTSFSL